MKPFSLKPFLWGLLIGALAIAAALYQYERKPKLKGGWHHGAFMEIFVRSYKDSNGDGIGDLKGLIQSLKARATIMPPFNRLTDRRSGLAKG